MRIPGGGLERERSRRGEGPIVPPTQTIHRWGCGTGRSLFALESPRRLLCSHGLQNALGDSGGEVKPTGDNTGGKAERWGSERKGGQKKKEFV